MDYIHSRFNFHYQRSDGEHVVYNTFSKALVTLNPEEYAQFTRCAFDSDPALEQTLAENGILINEEFDELLFLKYIHYRSKFSHKKLILTIAPTLDCNFGCPYCYENRRKGKMSQQVQDALVDYIRDAVSSGTEALDIAWYGGEPLMFPDVVESLGTRIRCLAQKHGCLLKMHMVTNGYLLTPAIVEMLDRIGVTRVQITLDGLKERHDCSRPLRGGGGTFDRIMENLRLFADRPIEVVVRMNVDRRNHADFQGLKALIAGLDNPGITLYASPVEDLNPDTCNTVSEFMSSEEFDEFTMRQCDEGGLDADDFAVMDDRFCFCTAETEQCYVVDDLGDCYKCWDEVGRKEYCCFNLLALEDANVMNMAKYLAVDPFSDSKCSQCVFLPLCFGGCKFQRAHLEKSVCGFTPEVLEKYIETAYFSSPEGE